mmetsp:Transcript_30136/g.70593  ORF Transcript_30136/g.70593 Transcript_30136/m.70593 type:complete len:253 (-) Transcript_30136:88-846(-)
MRRLLAAVDELRRAGLGRADAAGPRPNVLGRPDVGVARHVAQEPEGRPQAADVVLAGEDDLGLNDAAGEAELVPPLQHGAAEVLGVVHLLLLHVGVADDLGVGCLGLDNQLAFVVGEGVRPRVVVLRVVGVIVLLHGGPLGVLSVVEGSAGRVELVGEHKIVRPFDRWLGRGHRRIIRRRRRWVQCGLIGRLRRRLSVRIGRTIVPVPMPRPRFLCFVRCLRNSRRESLRCVRLLGRIRIDPTALCGTSKSQ